MMIIAKTDMDKMPKGCAYCSLSDGDCKCLAKNKYNLLDATTRPSWCPLAEIETSDICGRLEKE